jgi:hypothetical protein
MDRPLLVNGSTMRAATYGHEPHHQDDASDESPEVVWFDRKSLRPIPSPLRAARLLPFGFSGDRLWRARGWSNDEL